MQQWLALASRMLAVLAIALEVYGQAGHSSIWKGVGHDSVK